MSSREAKRQARTNLLARLGYGFISTGGGCTAMHLALPGDWYILLTGATADTCDSRPDWREPWLTMGLYNDDSQPIRTKLVNSEYGGARIRIEELETLTREYAKLAADKFGSGDVSQPRSFHWQL